MFHLQTFTILLILKSVIYSLGHSFIFSRGYHIHAINKKYYFTNFSDYSWGRSILEVLSLWLRRLLFLSLQYKTLLNTFFTKIQLWSSYMDVAYVMLTSVSWNNPCQVEELWTIHSWAKKLTLIEGNFFRSWGIPWKHLLCYCEKVSNSKENFFSLKVFWRK